MIALTCACEKSKKNGKDRRGNQRFKCVDCGRTWTEKKAKPLGDMRIDQGRAVMALKMLLEGMSIRATERITSLHRDTICDLILTVGDNCKSFLERTVVDVEVNDVQCDEIWSFVGCKEKTKKRKGYEAADIGDCWTFIAVERNTKLVWLTTLPSVPTLARSSTSYAKPLADAFSFLPMAGADTVTTFLTFSAMT